ncbi:2OG-Fe(II) oxygenase [Cupriavidus sp. 30B13]|uniref:2OG-Fe(II) oxygenase n=1 Tax=Cupriavidus sp. 30B13 TaxID=3384241 RepID=UPI003B90941D
MSELENLFAALEAQGWAVSDHLVGAELAAGLHGESRAAWEAGLFHPARVGRGEGTARAEDIRGDSILWLGDLTAGPATREFQAWAAEFRRALNGRYFLGLKREEFHFSHYPVGTAYKKHLDQHRATRDRQVSLVLYLNDEWGEHDGGELAIYPPGAADGAAPHRVLPRLARLAVFRSDLIPHEVLPCRRTRWALTGWFRTDAA